MPPTDIDLPKHAEATAAALHRDGDGWCVTFSGSDGFEATNYPISDVDLSEAGIDPSQDRVVVGYVETRLLAAGYGFQAGDDSPSDVLEAWTLR
jgi:hypothetical protein